MTTLVIVGLVVGGVMLAAPSDDREVRAFAESFAARVGVAADDSIMRNRPVALRLTEDGFGFERMGNDGWAPISGRTPLAFRAWPDGISYRVESPSDHVDGIVASFDVLGGASPARIVLERGEARWRVEINSNGSAHVSSAE